MGKRLPEPCSSGLAVLQLDEGATKFNAYFPKGTWYNLRSHARVVSAGEKQTLTQALHEPANAYIAGGNIIPTAKPAMTTREVCRYPDTSQAM
jgi:alpha-glucosidase (family GH31 glycosyl hydrolase)